MCLRAFWCNYLNCVLSDCALLTRFGSYIQLFNLSFGSNIALSFKIGQLAVFLSFPISLSVFFKSSLSDIPWNHPELYFVSSLFYQFISFLAEKPHLYHKSRRSRSPFFPDRTRKRLDTKRKRSGDCSGSFTIGTPIFQFRVILIFLRK